MNVYDVVHICYLYYLNHMEYLNHACLIYFVQQSKRCLFFRDNDKANLFTDDDRYSQVAQVKGEISSVVQELKDYRKDIRLALRQPSLDYTTVLQAEVNFQKGFQCIACLFASVI